jgi:hypothetical protein
MAGRTILVLTTFLVACATSGASGGGHANGPATLGQSAPGSGDRVLVPDFGDVTAMAASARLVFAAAPRGIGVLDRQFGRWLPPLTVLNGLPRGRINILAGDPVEDAVWVGIAGGLSYYRPP